MSLVNNNPYQTPQVDDSVDLSEKRDGTWATVIFGAWAGVFFGGMFGLGGSLLLGLSRGPLLGWDQLTLPLRRSEVFGPVELLIVSFVEVAIVGAISGIACGLVIGPLVGWIAEMNSRRFRRFALLTAVALSTLAGALIGLHGGDYLVVRYLLGSSNAVVAVIAGALIGGTSGLLGGRLLGRGILAFGKQAN